MTNFNICTVKLYYDQFNLIFTKAKMHLGKNKMFCFWEVENKNIKKWGENDVVSPVSEKRLIVDVFILLKTEAKQTAKKDKQI